MANFRHTWTVNIVHISSVGKIDDDKKVSIRNWIETLNPDLVISTGDPGTLFSSQRSDVLVLPGSDDDRSTFASRFGRRYRIDDTYPYLDRTVHVMGLAILLVDSTSSRLAEKQLLWLRSQLHELADNAGRGNILPRFVIFSHRTLLSNPEAEQILSEVASFLNASGVPGTILSVFSGKNKEESVVHRAGVRQYTVPAVNNESALRIIRVDTDGSLETAVVYKDIKD